MSKRAFGISMAILTVVIGMLVFLNIREDAREEACDMSFPMVNQNITWEGAGYNGIYGK